jgi:hypothetical protein
VVGIRVDTGAQTQGNRLGIPCGILREMRRDGTLPSWVVILGPPEEPQPVYCTPAMRAWCETKAQAQPANAAYRRVGVAISRTLRKNQAMRCKYGHMHPPERVWVTTGNLSKPSPYHCSECLEREKGGLYWRPFDSPVETGRRACRACFPSN